MINNNIKEIPIIVNPKNDESKISFKYKAKEKLKNIIELLIINIKIMRVVM